MVYILQLKIANLFIIKKIILMILKFQKILIQIYCMKILGVSNP